MPTKQKLHPRNRHNEHYDFTRLCQVSPSLKQFVIANKSGQPSINFASPLAVKALNSAVLAADYDIENWDIPEGFLCPPIPGRVDYIHYIADLLNARKKVNERNEKETIGLDIGTGASCIYPLLGQREYRWQFIASDIDPVSISASQRIIDNNRGLSAAIRLCLQPDSQHVFRNVITPEERIDFTMCNPPFHESLEQAAQSNARKRRNLGSKKKAPANSILAAKKQNFGAQAVSGNLSAQ